jgi:hypothetical protein
VQTRMLIAAAVLLAALACYVWWTETGDEPEVESLEEGEEALFEGLEPEGVVALSATVSGKGLVLRREEESDWQVGEEARPADQAMAETAVRASLELTSLRRLEGAGDPADYGLGDSALRVVIGLDGGVERSFRVGDRPAIGEGRYLLLEADSSIHLADAWSLSTLERDPLDFRDRRLAPIETDDVVAITIRAPEDRVLALRRDGRRWFLEGETPWRAESSRVRDFLLDVVELQARSYPATPALPDEVTLQVELADAEGQTAVVTFHAGESLGEALAIATGPLLEPGFGDEVGGVADELVEGTDLDPERWRAFELLDFNPWLVDRIEWSAGGQTWELVKEDDAWSRSSHDAPVPLDEVAVQTLLEELDALRAAAYAPAELEPDEAGVQQARIVLSASDGSQVGLTLHRGPNKDFVVLDEEPGLREVDSDVHALIGHLRPLEAEEDEPELDEVETPQPDDREDP